MNVWFSTIPVENSLKTRYSLVNLSSFFFRLFEEKTEQKLHKNDTKSLQLFSKNIYKSTLIILNARQIDSSIISYRLLPKTVTAKYNDNFVPKQSFFSIPNFESSTVFGEFFKVTDALSFHSKQINHQYIETYVPKSGLAFHFFGGKLKNRLDFFKVFQIDPFSIWKKDKSFISSYEDIFTPLNFLKDIRPKLRQFSINTAQKMEDKEKNVLHIITKDHLPTHSNFFDETGISFDPIFSLLVRYLNEIKYNSSIHDGFFFRTFRLSTEIEEKKSFQSEQRERIYLSRFF